METSTKKITLSTVKSFIKKNQENLFISVKSSFDGSIDGVRYMKRGFEPVKASEKINPDRTLGIKGAWFVGGSRDYFEAYDNCGFIGIEICNSCGHFILAVQK